MSSRNGVRPQRRRESLAERANASIPERIYQAIKRDIVSMKLPPGSPMSEPSLAQTHRASRTPVREALRRLEQEGLVFSVPRRGTFVAQASLRDVVEIDQIRDMIEPASARIAAMNADDAEIAAIITTIEKTQALRDPAQAHVAYLIADSEVHDLILRATGNKVLAETVRALHNRTSSVRFIASRNRTKPALAELLAIAKALKRRDGPGAEAAMRDHLRAAREARAGIAG